MWFFLLLAIYKNSGANGKVFIESIEASNLGKMVYGGGSNLIKNELGAYGEMILGSGSAYLQSNVRFFSTKYSPLYLGYKDLSKLTVYM